MRACPAESKKSPSTSLARVKQRFNAAKIGSWFLPLRFREAWLKPGYPMFPAVWEALRSSDRYVCGKKYELNCVFGRF